MKKFLKNVVRETLKIFNLKLSFYDKSKPRYIRAIDSLGINVIFDIGANDGGFALQTLDWSSPQQRWLRYSCTIRRHQPPTGGDQPVARASPFHR